jgi:hypothetical protein
MKFKQTKWLVVLCSLPLLSACAGSKELALPLPTSSYLGHTGIEKVVDGDGGFYLSNAGVTAPEETLQIICRGEGSITFEVKEDPSHTLTCESKGDAVHVESQFKVAQNQMTIVSTDASGTLDYRLAILD